ITPPDFISDILVIVPLLLLYELSVTISRVVYKKRLGNESIA
ncbi:twin-arginine translocase subunit TatC, partial [Bacillus subtilis]